MDERTKLYTSALMYQGPGHDFPFQACNGPALTFVDNDRVSVEGSASFYEVGSLIVKAGCTFYGFSEAGFSGEGLPIRGPAVYSQSPGFDYGLAKGFRSFHTECDMSYINCTPEDQFEVIFTCDAIGAVVDTECRYTKTIGTSFSEEISASMSIDTTIETSMSTSFFGLFESSIGISVSTGYNWGSVTTETTETQQTYEVSAVAPAGTVLVIEQAVGHCDGSTVNTEMFRISHHTKSGELIKTEIVHGKL